jgi:hypothetical protein
METDENRAVFPLRELGDVRDIANLVPVSLIGDQDVLDLRERSAEDGERTHKRAKVAKRQDAMELANAFA